MKPTDQLARAHLAPEPRDLARLLAGEHHNPHSVLGAHEYGDHTIIRAFRNAGIDLQSRVAEDIRAAPAAYPDVRRPNSSIDHRRVKTLLIWFLRHVPQVREGPARPGDVVFLDTFPSRRGPDHVGIISDRMAPSGLPFVITAQESARSGSAQAAMLVKPIWPNACCVSRP